MSKIICLNSCPFCGGAVDINEGFSGQDELDDDWVILCNDCPAEMRGRRNASPSDMFPDDRSELIEQWNKRV